VSDEQIVSMINPGIEENVVSLPLETTDMTNLQSNKEEFNKLPSKSSTPTMTYAGIGSRETPKEVMDQMTELAKELESRGYTLRSGGAQGADTAFEKGVTSKKEIFPGAQKSGEREMKIAREIHPNPNALDNSKNPQFVWNLMARNTNQVFGKNLDTPVDFVIAWTQDGLTDYTKRTVKSGGTGQAIDMASRKGIPVINLANSNWRQELDRVLSLPTEEVITESVEMTGQPKGIKVKDGIYVNQEALTKDEQLELFDYLKPFLEEQAAKTNKGASASKMIGLGLRWDYKSNNPGKQSMNIPDVINPGNKTKYGYYNTSINGQSLAPITPRFRELMQKATGVDMTNYDGAIINLYEPNSFISSHNDVDESRSAIGYPVIGINIGGTGNFSIESRDGAPKQLDLKAGAGYVFGVDGVNREVYHRTFAKPQDSFLPELTTKLDGKIYEAGSYRVTVTMRRVMPLEPGIPSKPGITSEATVTEQVAQPEQQLSLFNLMFGDTITLKDGKEYNKIDVNSNMLEAMGYTPKEIGRILKSIC
jgi:alkylated DNA repair dioxygenase AlkB